RSVLQVATVADHLTMKADLRVAPFDGRIGLREPSDDREPVTALEFRDGLPPIESAKAMLGRCADRPSARQSDLVNGLAPDDEDSLRLRRDEAVIPERPHHWPCSHKFRDGNSPSVCEAHDRFRRYAFAECRELRFASRIARGPRELRQTDDDHVQLARE